MRISYPVVAAVVVASMLAAAGCGSHSKSSAPASSGSTSTSATQAALSGDYTTLLIKASDINAPDAFTAGPPVNNPNGQQGATVTFTDQDHSHSIIDTIVVAFDPAAAANELDSAKQQHHETLLAKPLSAEVGVDGTTITGTSPDHTKGVTVLLFTQGKAFVTLEFDGPTYALAPSDFVLDVGHKQDDAIKKGLGT
jgi:outer membrane murein-binding lipoprotein Lpp